MKIILADDQPEVCSALRLLLEQRTGQVPVSEASDIQNLLAQAHSLHPDLVLLDWELPGLPQVKRPAEPRPPGEVVAMLRSLVPEVKVVALSGRPEARKQALAAEVDGFVSKSDPPEQLLAILEELGLRHVR